MTSTGPLLESLLRRLIDCPPDFLLQPRIRGAGIAHVGAVVSDVLLDLTGEGLSEEEASAFVKPAGDSAGHWQALALITCWLVHDQFFRAPGAVDGPELKRLFLEGLKGRALQPVQRFVEDPERREELARFVLRELNLLPFGETPEQSADKFAAVDSIGSLPLVELAVRRAAVRAAMQRRAAMEAAAKATRE